MFSAKQLPPLRGRHLDDRALMFNLTRRRWCVFRESDKSLRVRLLYVIDRWQTRVAGTISDVKRSTEDQCIGLIEAVVTDGQGRVAVRLRHRWWGHLFARGNRRRARQFLRSNVIATGVQLEVR